MYKRRTPTARNLQRREIFEREQQSPALYCSCVVPVPERTRNHFGMFCQRCHLIIPVGLRRGLD